MIELECESRGGSTAEEMLARLERLEERADHLRVPRSFATVLYTLRVHIGLVRSRLKERIR